jgi:hypothetical protein
MEASGSFESECPTGQHGAWRVPVWLHSGLTLFQNQHDIDEQLARQLEQEEIAAATAASSAPVRQRTLPSSTVAPGNPPAALADEPSIQEQVMKIAES